MHACIHGHACRVFVFVSVQCEGVGQGMEARSWHWVSFLNRSSPSFLEKVSHWLKCVGLARVTDEVQGFVCFSSPRTGVTDAHSTSALYMGSGDPNLDLHACVAGTLPTELSLQPLSYFHKDVQGSIKTLVFLSWETSTRKGINLYFKLELTVMYW